MDLIQSNAPEHSRYPGEAQRPRRTSRTGTRIAVDLFSNNQADLLSNNKTALLSGNRPTILSGNTPKILSENATPILSGNTFSVLSNIKVEIHIDNSGNNMASGATAQPAVTRAIRSPEPSRTPGPPRAR